MSSVAAVQSPKRDADYPSAKYAWWVVFVLMLALIVSFIDRHIVTMLVEPIKRDLHVNDAQIGWLFGGFALFYAVAGLPIARSADRRSRRAIISLGILLWSGMTVLCGLSRNFFQLFMARVGVGVGEATLGPSAHSIVGDIFPRHKIPRALSVFQLGAVIGSGFAFILGGFIVELVRNAPPVELPVLGVLRAWQQTFIYVGLPGVLVVLLMATVREPVRRLIRDSDGIEQAKASVRDVLGFYRQNWDTILTHHLGLSSLALVGWAFVVWTPTFFERVHGIPAGQAAQPFGLIYITAGPVGVIGAAYFAEYLTRRGRRDANLIAPMAVGLGIIPIFMLIEVIPSVEWVWALYIPGIALINAPHGVGQGALPVIVPPHMRAQIAAVYSVVGSIVGMMVGPVVAGAISDHIFTGPDGVRYSVMLVTGIFGPLGVVLLWLGRKPYARSLARAEQQAEAV